MKKLIASLTILATGAALASSVSSTATFGVLKITSTATQTIISVPWVDAGSSDVETITVKDFVKTSNLTGSDTVANADKLLVYNPTSGSGAYTGWYLNSSKVWTGYAVAYNTFTATAGQDTDKLTRGSALILIRNSTTDPDIYLYGQYRDPSRVSYTITRAADRTTLFAPVNTTSTVINLNDLTWTNAQAGDKIKLQGTIPLVFTYNGTNWGRTISTGRTTDGASIRPGEGVWYTTVSATGGDVTVSGI